MIRPIYRRHLLWGIPMLTEYGKQLMTERIERMTTPSKGQPYCPNCGSEEHLLCKVAGKGTWPNGGQPSVDNIIDDLVDGHLDSIKDLTRAGSRATANVHFDGPALRAEKAKAKSQLLAHALSCLPEKKFVHDIQITIIENERSEAHNAAIDLMEQKLRASYE